MNVEVHLFAAAKDAADAAKVSITLADNATVGTLSEHLVKTYPALKVLQETLHIAVNSQYATPDQIIREDDEIACFPPVSGG